MRDWKSVRVQEWDVVRIFESDVCDVDMVENPDSVIFDVCLLYTSDAADE